MWWKPRELWILVRTTGRPVLREKNWERERNQLLPSATHHQITPVTSYTPNYNWNVVGLQQLNEFADTFLSVRWLFHHMFNFLICNRKTTSWGWDNWLWNWQKSETSCERDLNTFLFLGVKWLPHTTNTSNGRVGQGQRWPGTHGSIMRNQ